MKICKDGRIWGQNNREARNHLGILFSPTRIKKGVEEGKYIRTDAIRKATSERRRGKRHWNWKGGITDKNTMIRNGIEVKLWRIAVFARDNWTCQECGKRGGRLHPHHIKSFAEYPELRYAIDNGRTLCLKCHKLTDNYCKKGETSRC